MNRIVWIAVVVVSMLWLSGCVVVSSERHGLAGGVRIVRVPPEPVVEVIHVPGPPRPHHHHGPPRTRPWR